MLILSSIGIYNLLKILFVVIAVYILLRELYILTQRGKFIIKINKRRFLKPFWALILALLVLYFIYDYIRINYKSASGISPLLPIITASIIIFIKIAVPEKKLEIRENGIYIFSNFYKWNEVKSYS